MPSRRHETLYPAPVAGVDEAGRGPLAGPVAVAAVVFDPDRPRINGLDDSKQLTADRREQLYARITERALAWHVVLVTPAEKMRIVVEDAPFLAVLLRTEGEGRAQKLIFTTNVGDETVAGKENPIRVVIDPATREPSPYVHVRRGLEAKISRPVFYQLVDLAVPGEGEHEGKLVLWSDGVAFPLDAPA